MRLDRIVKSLADAVEQCKATGLTKMPDLPTFVRLPDAPVQALFEVLKEDPDFCALEKMHFSLTSQRGVVPFSFIPRLLISRVLLGASPEVVAESLLRICSDKTVDLWDVIAIASIPVSENIELSEQVHVSPPASLPSARNTISIFSQKHRGDDFKIGPPTGAIVIRNRRHRALYDGPIQPEAPEALSRRMIVRQEIIERARIALILSSSSVPDVRQNYNIVSDVGWVNERSSGFSLSESFPRPPAIGGPANAVRAPKIFKALEFHTNTSLLKLAVAKLESFRREFDPVEKAIDIGTCLEIILMHDTGNENTEINFKIGTRAAWLLGRDPADRMRIFDLARKLYALRSTAVHSGTLKLPKTMQEMEVRTALFHEFDALAVGLIEAIVLRGKWPDWKSLTLGGETPNQPASSDERR